MAEKKLKKGFTTGAAAAAAVKAALTALVSDDAPKMVTISFLTGQKKSIPVHTLEKSGPDTCRASIIKDGGDDPDITHKARIGAVVTLIEPAAGRAVDPNSDLSQGPVLEIIGGKGVGSVTKPGLELPVGEPAINPGPRTMIRNSVKEVFSRFDIQNKQVRVEVFVKNGEALAKKTLNARLGILGGISILGTTGIVTPMSHDAYIATIKSGLAVANAKGADTMVFTTGRRSERFAMDMFTDFSEEVFIQTGDFFKAALDKAVLFPGIQTVIYTIFFGKAVKMALGFEHTHAAKSELTLRQLSSWAGRVTGDEQLEEQIAAANTARHAFEYIYPGYPELLAFVGKKILENATRFSDQKLQIRAIIFDFEGRVAFDSKR